MAKIQLSDFPDVNSSERVGELGREPKSSFRKYFVSKRRWMKEWSPNRSHGGFAGTDEAVSG